MGFKDPHQDLPTFKKTYFPDGFPKSEELQTVIGIYQEFTIERNNKLYLFKIIQPEKKYIPTLEKFMVYLLGYLEFNTKQTNYLFQIEAYVQEKSKFYILQRFHQHRLKPMEELKALMVLRGLSKLYRQFSEEPEIFKLMRDLNIIGPSIETVFYYFSSPPPNKKKLPRTKVKIDLLKFREKPWTTEISVDRLHLNEIGDFINGLILRGKDNGGKLGICSRTIFHRIEKNQKTCDWNKMFANPLICQDKTANPDLKYWRISKFDKQYLREEENNYEENKTEFRIISEIRKRPEKAKEIKENSLNSTDLVFLKALMDGLKNKFYGKKTEITDLDVWLEITLDKLEKHNKIKGIVKNSHQVMLIKKFDDMERSEKAFMKIVKKADCFYNEEIARLNQIIKSLKIFDVE